MPEPSALGVLAELLRGRGTEPILSLERLAPSTVYDLEYRLVVVACALHFHGDKETLGIKPARLKLVQFVATRPWLLPMVREWSVRPTDPQATLAISHGLRRGFLGDTVHEAVIQFAIAS